MARRPKPGSAHRLRAYGLPAGLTLRPGTYLTVRVNQFLSSDRNQQGDTFAASLAQPVVVDGVVVAQRGQTLYGRVSEVEKNRGGSPSRLGLELVEMTLVDGTQTAIRSQVIARTGTTTPTGQQVGTVAATTGVGAAVGAVADYGRGAAIGAGVGAMAGIVGVILTRDHPTEVYPETVLTFQVMAPVAINTANAPQAFRYVGPDEYDRPYVTQSEPRPRHAPPGLRLSAGLLSALLLGLGPVHRCRPRMVRPGIRLLGPRSLSALEVAPGGAIDYSLRHVEIRRVCDCLVVCFSPLRPGASRRGPRTRRVHPPKALLRSPFRSLRHPQPARPRSHRRQNFG